MKKQRLPIGAAFLFSSKRLFFLLHLVMIQLENKKA